MRLRSVLAAQIEWRGVRMLCIRTVRNARQITTALKLRSDECQRQGDARRVVRRKASAKEPANAWASFATEHWGELLEHIQKWEPNIAYGVPGLWVCIAFCIIYCCQTGEPAGWIRKQTQKDLGRIVRKEGHEGDMCIHQIKKRCCKEKRSLHGKNYDLDVRKWIRKDGQRACIPWLGFEVKWLRLLAYILLWTFLKDVFIINDLFQESAFEYSFCRA